MPHDFNVFYFFTHGPSKPMLSDKLSTSLQLLNILLLVLDSSTVDYSTIENPFARQTISPCQIHDSINR
jgi:hypothetical protein